MKKIIKFILHLYFFKLSCESKYTRLEAIIKARNIPLFSFLEFKDQIKILKKFAWCHHITLYYGSHEVKFKNIWNVKK